MKNKSRKVQKLRESLYVNIPANIVKSLGLKVEDMIAFEEKNGRVTLTKESKRD